MEFKVYDKDKNEIIQYPETLFLNATGLLFRSHVLNGHFELLKNHKILPYIGIKDIEETKIYLDDIVYDATSKTKSVVKKNPNKATYMLSVIHKDGSIDYCMYIHAENNLLVIGNYNTNPELMRDEEVKKLCGD